MWLLAKGLSFSLSGPPYSLSEHRFRVCDFRESKEKTLLSFELVPKVVYLYFCFILFIRIKSLSPAHTTREGN